MSATIWTQYIFLLDDQERLFLSFKKMYGYFPYINRYVVFLAYIEDESTDQILPKHERNNSIMVPLGKKICSFIFWKNCRLEKNIATLSEL